VILMFGYKCQECGQGTVQPTTFRNYETRFGKRPFVVPEAVIGVCDLCGAQHFNAREWKRWRQLHAEQHEARVKTTVSMPASVHLKLQSLRKTRKCSQSAIITELIRNAS